MATTTIDEIKMWSDTKDTTTIDEMIKALTQIKEKHGNINVVLQYQDDGGSYSGHTNGIYAVYVDDEGDGKPIVVLE